MVSCLEHIHGVRMGWAYNILIQWLHNLRKYILQYPPDPLLRFTTVPKAWPISLVGRSPDFRFADRL